MSEFVMRKHETEAGIVIASWKRSSAARIANTTRASAAADSDGAQSAEENRTTSARKEKNEMIDSFEKIIDPNFINAELIGGPGASRVVTITDIDYKEAWNSKRNAKEMRQCLVFAETKPLILNKTNARKLKEIFSPNEDKPENCIGKQIELYVIETTVGRAKTTGIRIREHAAEPCQECGNPITPLQGKTVDWTIQYSMKHTGKKLCPNCMRNWANKNTNQEENS